MKKLKASKHRIALLDGRELQFHPPFHSIEPTPLTSFIPEGWKAVPLEMEIGPGKGEFLARRASENPGKYFVGIDRRQDRVQLTQNKLSGKAPTFGTHFEDKANWKVIREDARKFVLAGLPPLSMLHVYHPDPWPKAKHHKNRFFRSPDAKAWARALVPGAELRVSTDHAEYFEEIVDILNSWTDLGEIECVYSKTSSAGHANTHFEALFLGKGQPVYKLIFRRAPL